jgi:hypothetical protein
MATCFWLEVGLYFSLHAERVRGFVAVWNIGFYTTQSVVEFSYHGIHTIASDFSNVGVHL